MDFDDSFFEGNTGREKKIVLQPYDARFCEKLWFLSGRGAKGAASHAENGDLVDGSRRGADEIQEPECERLKACSEYYYLRKHYVRALRCAVTGIECTQCHRVGVIRDMSETAVRCLLQLGHAHTAVPIALSLLAGLPSDLSLWQLTADCFFCAGHLGEELVCRQRCIRLNNTSFASWLALYGVYCDIGTRATGSSDTTAVERTACCNVPIAVSQPDRQGAGNGGISSPRPAVGLSAEAPAQCRAAGEREHAQEPCNGGVAHENGAEEQRRCSCLCSADLIDCDAALKHWLSRFGSHDQAMEQAKALTGECDQVDDVTVIEDNVMAAEQSISCNPVTAGLSKCMRSRIATLDLQPMVGHADSKPMQLALACLAHARCHLEIGSFASSSFARQRTQAMLSKLLDATKQCPSALTAYEEWRKAFQVQKASDVCASREEGADGASSEHDVYARFVTPQRNGQLGFTQTWFPWLADG